VQAGSRRKDLRGIFFGAAVAVLMASLVGACATARANPGASASATDLPSGSPGETPAASNAAASPSPSPVWTPDPAPSIEDYSDPTPLPPPPSGPLPNVPAAPAGTWTAVNWIALPGGNYPAVPAGNDYVYSTATLEGWSKGYVEFLWDSSKRTIVPWVSADGLRWKPGTKLDLGAWAGDFATWDEELGDSEFDPEEPDYHDSCTVTVSGFEEGPSTLLMRAYFDCAGGCGGPWFTSGEAFWTSPDGMAWSALDPKQALGVDLFGSISGGSSGFISLGQAGDGDAEWVSTDGRAWTRGTLPPDGFRFAAPVAYAGGFVLPGVVSVRKGHQGWLGGMCGPGGPTDLGKYEGALWWSSDGLSWTRVALTGTVGFGVDMSVYRIDDETLLASETTSGSQGELTGQIQWLSRDGKTWKRTGLVASPYSYWGSQILAGRHQGLILTTTILAGGEEVCDLHALDGNLKLISVGQSGDQPWEFGVDVVIGPTGLLASADGQRFWIGVPAAG
jgi:hypothetical protein